MKRIYSFVVASVAVLAAVSCNKEINQENLPVGETVVYTASTDNAGTRAVLNETTRKSEWVAGDAITVHDGAQGWTFTSAEAGANVDFSNSEGFGEYRPVLAVYPAGEYTANVEEKTVKAYIPTWQQAQAGTYHASAALAVAYSEGSSFAFKNAHTLLKFTVNTDNVTHIVFHGNGSEAITGDVNVTLGAEGVEKVECLETEFTEQQWNEETQQNEDVKVKKYGTWVECYAYHGDNNKYFVKGETYYIAVAPQVFEGGVTVKVRINEGEELVAKSTTKKVEAKINTILDLGEITYEVPEVAVDYWAVIGSMTDNWNSEIEMTLDGDWYVAEGVKILASDLFKFRANGNWDINVGGKGVENEEKVVIADGVETEAYQGGLNFAVAADGVYSLYINKTANKVKVVKTGDIEVEEVTPGEASEWALLGVFSGWADRNFVTTPDADIVVLENVEMKAAEGFLVRKPATEWADKYGAGNVNYIQANSYITTAKDGGDMCLEADGTYDIYFKISTKTIYVMTDGTDYTAAVEQIVSGKEPEAEEPEVTANMLYLKPNSNWKVDNARFAAYFFGNGDKWVSMTDSDGDGIYEVNIPEGYDYGSGNVIFCRMNPNTTANNWNNKWNQTADLVIPSDGTNLYTVKDDTWDKGGGTWSTK